MELRTTRKAVQNKLLRRFDVLKESVTSAEESGTRQPIVGQEELAARDATIITIMRVKETVAGRIATLIMSVYARRTVVFIAKREDISPNTVGPNKKKKLERTGRKRPIQL